MAYIDRRDATVGWIMVCERKYDHYPHEDKLSKSYSDRLIKVILGATDFMEVFSKEQNTEVLLDLCNAIETESVDSSTENAKFIENFVFEVRNLCEQYKQHKINSNNLTINIHRLIGNIKDEIVDNRLYDERSCNHAQNNHE